MLETLKTYAEPPRSLWKLVLEHRPGIIALSVACHFLFYTTIILLDRWAIQELREKSRRRAASTELVKIADLGGGSDLKLTLRRPPETVDPANFNRLKLDLHNADDTRLISKSPRPGSPDADPNRGKNKDVQAAASANPTPQERPPQSRSVSVAQTVPQPSNQQAGPLPVTAPAPAPGPPRESQPAANNEPSDRPRVVGRNAGDPGELGLQLREGQYIAAVRTKIYKLNERMMPRDWVKTTLADKVSADFDIVLGRGGRLVALKLTRSCGYTTLDTLARQAIVSAAPFEGWPIEASDNLPFTVTVFYTPAR